MGIDFIPRNGKGLLDLSTRDWDILRDLER